MERNVRVTLSRLALVALVIVSGALAGCEFKKAEVGSAENPIKLFFVPSVDAKVIDSNSKVMKEWLEANTPYKYEIKIPQSYIAVIEAFGSKGADIAALNTSGYIKAHEKYGAEARLIVIRHGKKTYQSQFIAKKGRFKSLKDLEGKRVAFVDAASMSGYLLPLKMLHDAGVKLGGDPIFAMRHDNVVSMVYQGQTDAGATFYSPPDEKEGIQDARRLVRAQYPDVENQIEIVQLTDEIPNDPITFRKDLPEAVKTAVTDAFLAMVKTPEGLEAFKAVYGVTGIERATDADFDSVREMLKKLNKSADDLLGKK
ncbi:MAG: phosphate/phosphite/phosphonate ABC transporter substrate-binding protein [Bdellovibrionales bacterium]|jgi:phosphonate transport system substrate-binding protein|nr:phosphate/phosphite/phosphonate ABC transporter substrate-binding protein [Bdellovibrionales bacterium]